MCRNYAPLESGLSICKILCIDSCVDCTSILSYCARRRAWCHGHANESYRQCPFEWMLAGSLLMLFELVQPGWMRIRISYLGIIWILVGQWLNQRGTGFVEATACGWIWLNIVAICTHCMHFLLVSWLFHYFFRAALTDWWHQNQTAGVFTWAAGCILAQVRSSKAEWKVSWIQLMSARSSDPTRRSFFTARTRSILLCTGPRCLGDC